jgi:hypothetical protein
MIDALRKPPPPPPVNTKMKGLKDKKECADEFRAIT